VGRFVIGVFIIVTSAANWAQAQSCDLFIAALRALGADSANTILVDHTVMGVPTFAFNAFSSLVRGDTALASAAERPLRELNATRVPVPDCLTTEHAWAVVSDSVLVGLFRAGQWTAFHTRFPKAAQFALVSRPLINGDTATLYVAVAAGKLSGRGVIMRFVRGVDGRWIKQSEVQLWVS
jgi:hypothetical protein